MFKKLLNNVFSSEGVHIINCCPNVEKYIKATKHSNDKSYKHYERYIYRHYLRNVNKYIMLRDRHLAGFGLSFYAFENRIALKKNIALITELKIEEVIKESYFECSRVILNPDLKVLLFPTCEYTCGFTPSSNFIVLYVNCSGNQEEVHNQVRWTFAHEYAHTCDIKDADLNSRDVPTHNDTVLKDMVFEGKANTFANTLFGHHGPQMEREYCSKDWAFYKERLNEPGYTISYDQQCQLGSDSFSRYDVYFYGTELVERYLLTNPDTLVSEVIGMKPERFYGEKDKI